MALIMPLALDLPQAMALMLGLNPPLALSLALTLPVLQLPLAHKACPRLPAFPILPRLVPGRRLALLPLVSTRGAPGPFPLEEGLPLPFLLALRLPSCSPQDCVS